MTDNILPADDAKPASSWAQWFDRCADYYQDPRMKMSYYKNGKTGEPVSMEELHAIHSDVWDKLDAHQKSILLDVGSGIGLFIQAYQDRVRKIIGTDISFNMMKDALAINPQGTFLQCDGTHLPFHSKSFDCVLCYSVFHYLGDNDQATKTLDEFARVVKNDGAILIGDILLSEKPANPSQNQDSTKTVSEKKNQWWPSCLNHSLAKKTFEPSFFMNYCEEKKYNYQILSQNIPSKITATSRYDVLIRL